MAPRWVLHVVTLGQAPVAGQHVHGSNAFTEAALQQQQAERAQRPRLLYSLQPAEGLYSYAAVRGKRVEGQLSKAAGAPGCGATAGGAGVGSARAPASPLAPWVRLASQCLGRPFRDDWVAAPPAAGKLSEALVAAGVQLTRGVAVDLGAAPGEPWGAECVARLRGKAAGAAGEQPAGVRCGREVCLRVPTCCRRLDARAGPACAARGGRGPRAPRPLPAAPAQRHAPGLQGGPRAGCSRPARQASAPRAAPRRQPRTAPPSPASQPPLAPASPAPGARRRRTRWRASTSWRGSRASTCWCRVRLAGAACFLACCAWCRLAGVRREPRAAAFMLLRVLRAPHRSHPPAAAAPLARLQT